ncbi:MAG: ABC transporter ATP-binding protein [Bacteroidetes bacterium]|nr:ABC transporter ATP-binding protein [Bacteroidota bacterium]
MSDSTISQGSGLPTKADAAPSRNALMEIRNLGVQFPGVSGPESVIDDLSLSIRHGEILGLVGESGCGKSMLARSIIGLIPSPGAVAEGEILFNGTDLLAMDDSERRSLRGNQISIILQEPMTSLNPVFTVGNQIEEILEVHHRDIRPDERRKRTIDMMKRIGIHSPEMRIDQYPHELSGGIRQRVMIAMALIGGNVQLLIADEPTTALDVTVQAQILDLFVKLQAEHQMAMLLITHDLGVVAQTAHRVAVMYAGRLVEVAPVEELFDQPMHPYTRGLMRSLPRPGSVARKSPLPSIPGTVPIPSQLPAGCPFFDRCEYRNDESCLNSMPEPVQIETGHWARCHRTDELPPFEHASTSEAQRQLHE